MVVPDDQEIANERPTAAELVDAVGSDSTIFASEQAADVDEVVEIERIEIVEVVEPGHNDFLKKRRSIIIASMAVGCFILFALSVLISSRVSCICSKPDRVSDFKRVRRLTLMIRSGLFREVAKGGTLKCQKSM